MTSAPWRSFISKAGSKGAGSKAKRDRKIGHSADLLHCSGLDRQIEPYRHVVGRLLPGAHVTIDADIRKPVGGRRREQHVVDADAVVLLPGASLVIPKRVH